MICEKKIFIFEKVKRNKTSPIYKLADILCETIKTVIKLTN